MRPVTGASPSPSLSLSLSTLFSRIADPRKCVLTGSATLRVCSVSGAELHGKHGHTYEVMSPDSQIILRGGEDGTFGVVMTWLA